MKTSLVILLICVSLSWANSSFTPINRQIYSHLVEYFDRLMLLDSFQIAVDHGHESLKRSVQTSEHALQKLEQQLVTKGFDVSFLHKLPSNSKASSRKISAEAMDFLGKLEMNNAEKMKVDPVDQAKRHLQALKYEHAMRVSSAKDFEQTKSVKELEEFLAFWTSIRIQFQEKFVDHVVSK